MSKWYDVKMIVSGHVYEVLKYGKSVKVGETRNIYGRSLRASEESKKEIRKKTLNKAKSMIRRLINANINAWGETAKFVTLTFAENVTNVKQANYEFKKFRQRLEYKLKIKLKYVAVVEFQKRGAIHYHVVFFNLPYVENSYLANVWSNGFIKINSIDNVDNIGAYVTKYMTKEDYEREKTDKLIGQKSYFTSRGLKKPLEIYEKEKIEHLESVLSKHKVYTAEFSSDYLVKVSYSQYNTKRDVIEHK